MQESVNTRKGVERCIRYAFEYCRKAQPPEEAHPLRQDQRPDLCLEPLERAYYEVAKEYPDVKTDYAHVDATCMWMVKNPEFFDVIVTDNMFGDVITDLGAMIQGGMGVAAGGNINPIPDRRRSLSHRRIGPEVCGTNRINPLAAICSVQMMLEFLGETTAAGVLLDAVKKVIANDLKSMDAGKMGYGTRRWGISSSSTSSSPEGETKGPARRAFSISGPPFARGEQVTPAGGQTSR